MKTLRKLDINGDGLITREEWVEFFQDQRNTRLSFYESNVILKERCYLGLGIDPVSLSRGNSLICESRSQGWEWGEKYLSLPPGWMEDFTYYCENHHPLGTLMYKSQQHPYSIYLIVLDFIASVAFAFWGSGLSIILTFKRYSNSIKINEYENDYKDYEWWTCIGDGSWDGIYGTLLLRFIVLTFHLYVWRSSFCNACSAVGCPC